MMENGMKPYMKLKANALGGSLKLILLKDDNAYGYAYKFISKGGAHKINIFMVHNRYTSEAIAYHEFLGDVENYLRSIGQPLLVLKQIEVLYDDSKQMNLF